MISEAIGRCLVQDHGLENAAAVSIFTPNVELMHPGGLHASGEAEIAAVMNDGYELVIGDPMFRRPPASRTAGRNSWIFQARRCRASCIGMNVSRLSGSI